MNSVCLWVGNEEWRAGGLQQGPQEGGGRKEAGKESLVEKGREGIEYRDRVQNIEYIDLQPQPFRF